MFSFVTDEMYDNVCLAFNKYLDSKSRISLVILYGRRNFSSPYSMKMSYLSKDLVSYKLNFETDPSLSVGLENMNISVSVLEKPEKVSSKSRSGYSKILSLCLSLVHETKEEII